MKLPKKFQLWSLTGLGALLLMAQRPQTVGRVVGVQDGDTLTVLGPDQQQIRVRLVGIDAPESRQPYGAASKKSLSDLVFGKEVRLAGQEKDRYGRTLGNVYLGDLWINREQVVRGLAWHYTYYSDDPSLAAAEAEARQFHRGLWQDRRPVPPWDWRRQGKTR